MSSPHLLTLTLSPKGRGDQNPRPWHAALAAIALAWLLAGCGATEPAPAETELEPVPLPADLEEIDATVRDQLRERYADVERRTAAGAAAPGSADAASARLGRAFGELGQALAAYRYWQPAGTAFANAERLDETPRWSYYLGHAERALGRLEDSAAAFERFLAQRPDDVPARVWLGESQLDLGRLEAARGTFHQAAEAAPDCVQALFGLGRAALEEGDAEAAAGHLEAAAKRQPGSTRIRYSLALAHRQLGDAEDAAALFARVESDHLTEVPIALDDPLMAEVRELRRGAMAHERRGLRAAARGQMQLAVVELQQAVALDPERFDAWHNLGLALLRLGRFEEGKRELHRLLERHPEHAPTHLLLGNLALEQGDLWQAERSLRDAVDADPRLADARRALAALLRRTGKGVEARVHEARAEELSRGTDAGEPSHGTPAAGTKPAAAPEARPDPGEEP